MSDQDFQVRLAAFAWLRENEARFDGVFPREVLLEGFPFEGNLIPLVDWRKGIWKPPILPVIPLSFSTTVNSPYRDSEDDLGRLLYCYMGSNPENKLNRGLRRAMERGTPLIYFRSDVPGRYAAEYPAYIVGDAPKELMITVVFGKTESLSSQEPHAEPDLVRQYITRETKVRLHQKGFRELVLHAYHERCTCCRIGHRKLLDAAHIIPDNDPKGLPVISNGLSLCKIHHAAFDGNIFGIRPDYVIEVNKEVLREKDGPMLKHGLQGLHGQKIVVPRSAKLRPDPEHLEIRFEQFRKAG